MYLQLSLQNDFEQIDFPSEFEFGLRLNSTPMRKAELFTANTIQLVAKFKSYADLFKLGAAVHFIRNANKRANIVLNIPYFPFARQDRYTTEADAFTLKSYCAYINSLNVSEVIVFDAHSDVLGGMLNNVTLVDNTTFVAEALNRMRVEEHDVVFVSPDLGATKKIQKVGEYIGVNSVVTASKVRDPKTGALSKAAISLEGIDRNKHIVIIDDICDGGGTFVNLLKAIREAGHVGKVSLIISHGLFTRGLKNLRGFNYVVTTNSVYPKVSFAELQDAENPTLLTIELF